MLYLRRNEHWRTRATLEACLGIQVRIDVVLIHEEQTGVCLRGEHQSARQLVKEELENRNETLEIGLLVDGEVEVARFDLLQRLGLQIKTATVYAFGLKEVLFHDLPQALRAAGVDRTPAFQALIAQVLVSN